MSTPYTRPYDRVRELIERCGGTMEWKPMGQGGDWHLTLHERTTVVPCRDRTVNDLDRLYEPNQEVQDPVTWDDYEQDAPLKNDAFWRLVGLFPRN